MSPKKNPEAGGLGADVADADGGSDVSSVPPWRCPGPEVVPLPFRLHAILVRCEAAVPDSAVEMCDVCWSARSGAVS